MSKIVENEEYLNTEEVRKEFDNASKKRFYGNIKPYLKTYHFDAKKTPWYKRKDVIGLKNGLPVRKASISISGIQRDWTTFLRSLGYDVETKVNEVVISSLPEDAIETFNLPASKQYIKRTRMTFANRAPICVWSTYYPMDLVEDIADQLLQGSSDDIVKHIKDSHGVVVGRAKDKYTARITTFEEQALFQLLNEEPVLILQRVSYTRDKKILVLYSDMVLLGNWFAPEHEYDVDIWG